MELFAVIYGHDDKEEIDCNLKKVWPTSTSFVNAFWKNRYEIILVFPEKYLKSTSNC